MKQYFIIPLILISTILSAQERNSSTKIKEFFIYRNELGINATNVLGNVLSLNPNNFGTPYSIIYRRHFNRISLRLGGNYNQDKNTMFDFDGISSKDTELNEKKADFRIGFEVHYPIGPRFMFSFGLDGTYNRYLDDSKVTENVFTPNGNIIRTFESKETTDGYGGGPVLRFDFKLNDRISLSTESTFYYNYSKSTDKFSDGTIINNNTITDQSFVLTMPQVLFVNIAF